jgi:hypothetical protein
MGATAMNDPRLDPFVNSANVFLGIVLFILIVEWWLT